MRMASFNVENIFSRVAAFNAQDWSVSKPISDEWARVSDLLQTPSSRDADRRQ